MRAALISGAVLLVLLFGVTIARSQQRSCAFQPTESYRGYVVCHDASGRMSVRLVTFSGPPPSIAIIDPAQELASQPTR